MISSKYEHNSKVDISVLVPGIRPYLWEKVYDSMKESFSGSWEIIFIGPNDCPKLRDIPNVKFFESYASPMVCRQKALIASQGEYICYAADDVWFIKGSLNKAFETLADKDYTTLIVGKYAEGIDKNPKNISMVENDLYWTLAFHHPLKEIMTRFPHSYYIINTGLISRKLMIEIGGWDCRFETCAIGCVDLSLRLQIFGAKCILQDLPIFHSSHLPGGQGDHRPIHDGQTSHDVPLLEETWLELSAIKRSRINLNNWVSQPARWERRFKTSSYKVSIVDRVKSWLSERLLK